MKIWSFVKENKVVLIALFIIVLIGFFLRIFNVTQYPLHIEEVVFLDESRLDRPGLVEDFKWVAWKIFLKKDTVGEVLGTFLSRWNNRLFNSNVLAIRLTPAVLGTLTILIWFFIIRNLGKSNKLALFSAALLGFSFYHSAFSRYGYSHLSMSFWFLLYSALIYYFFHKPRVGILALSIIVFAIGFLALPTMIFAPLGIITFGIIYSIYKNKSKCSKYLEDINKKPVKYFLISLLIIFLISLILFPYKSLITSDSVRLNVFGPSVERQSLGEKVITYLSWHSENFISAQKNFWNLFSSDSFGGVIPLWIIIFSLIGLVVLLFSRSKQKYFFLFQFIFLYLFLNYFFLTARTFRAAVPFVFFFYFAATFGILFLVKKINKKAGIVFLILLILLELSFTINSLFLNNPNYPKATAFNPVEERDRFLSLVDYLKKENPEVIMVDSINHGPGYHFNDHQIPFEFIDYQTLSNRLENKDFPQYYLSNYLAREQAELFNKFIPYYEEKLPGLYVLKQ